MASRKALKSGLDEPVQVEEVSDPFAIDFFSQAKPASDEDEFNEEFTEAVLEESPTVVVKRRWNADLPQITAAEINQAQIISHLPDRLTNVVCEISSNSVSQIILQGANVANCETISTVETSFSEELIKIKNEQAACLSFAVEPSQNQAILVVDAIFAVKIIETALSSEASGGSSSAGERRELSQTELSVLEFLSLNCLKHINDYFSEPLFRWQFIEQSATNFKLGRGLLSHLRLQIGENIGIVKLLLPFDFLQGLSKLENPLLARRSSSGHSDKINRLLPLLPDVRLHTILGETTLDAAELAALEPGDVILIERAAVRFADSLIRGQAQVRIADETNPSLKGNLETNENLYLNVREISQKNENKLMRSIMPENQLENSSNNHDGIESVEQNQTEETTEGGLALEKIVVDVAVELASRRISLDEIANIRVGQVIELGSRATDPVELVTGGRTVAVGELIDVEGHLGVKLTRVLL